MTREPLKENQDQEKRYDLVLAEDLSPLLDGLRKGVEGGDGILPANACIGDGDAVLKAALALLGYLLVA